MHPVVRSFRATFVEGRFTPLLAAIGVIVLRVGLFYIRGLPPVSFPEDNYVWELIAPFFISPEVSLIASTLAVFMIAWILSLLNNRFNLIRSRSHLPFTVPLFLLSLHPYCVAMSANYIAVIFVLLAFFPLMESYQKPDAYLCSFRASILIAVASLFQIYALVLLPLWWFGERLMRGFRFHSFISSCFGLYLVYITLFSVYWMLDDIPRFVRPFLLFASLSVPEVPQFSIPEWGGVFLGALFFISSMIFSIKIYSRDKALTLSLMQFLVFLIIFLLLLQVTYWKETFFFLLLSVALISFLNAYFYSRTMVKNHIYVAYGTLLLMLLFYVYSLLPSMTALF